MLTQKIAQSANRVTFLLDQHRDLKLPQFIEEVLPGMTAVEINTALWAAQELGYISEPIVSEDKDKNNTVEIYKVPESDFGSDVEYLREMLMYAFTQLAKKENDLEDNYLKSWLFGFPVYDVEVARKSLVKEHKLAEYELTDPNDLASTYNFTTLYENGEQMWGKKQFTVQPTGEEKPETSPVETPDQESTTTTTTEGETE